MTENISLGFTFLLIVKFNERIVKEMLINNDKIEGKLSDMTNRLID